jgi:hypothetical protein
MEKGIGSLLQVLVTNAPEWTYIFLLKENNAFCVMVEAKTKKYKTRNNKTIQL